MKRMATAVRVWASFYWVEVCSAVAVVAAAAAVGWVLTHRHHPQPLTSGVVVQKIYDDPDEWTTPEQIIQNPPMCRLVGKVQVCTPQPPIIIPAQHHHDDAHWYLRISGKNSDGEWVTERHEVPHWKYADTHVGRTVDVAS